MKALTLVSFALFTSTSLFASGIVKIPVVPRNAEASVLVGESKTDTKSLLNIGSRHFADRASARATANYNEHLNRLRTAAGNPLANDQTMAAAASCISEKLGGGWEGSSCLANLLLGLRDLAANQCGMSAADVKLLRSECGLR